MSGSDETTSEWGFFEFRFHCFPLNRLERISRHLLLGSGQEEDYLHMFIGNL